MKEDIPCKLLSLANESMEGFYVEINLRKTKWLLCCSYNPSRSNIAFQLQQLNRNLALYSSCYESFMIIGDFNVKANNSSLSVFRDNYNLKTSLKSQPAIRIPIKLRTLTLC